MTQPLRRSGPKGEGAFEAIGWDEAIAATAGGAARGDRSHGPESVLPYYFAGTEGMIQGWIMGAAPVRGDGRVAAQDDDLHGGRERRAERHLRRRRGHGSRRTSSTRG